MSFWFQRKELFLKAPLHMFKCYDQLIFARKVMALGIVEFFFIFDCFVDLFWAFLEN